MNNTSRKIGEYEITHSVHIGEKEIVLGENQTAEDGQFYLISDIEQNEIFEQFNNCFVSDDFLELAEVFSQRLHEQIQKLKNEREQTHSTEMLTSDMCCPNSEKGDYENKVIVIKPTVLRPEYRNTVHQLYLATSGNGTRYGAIGTAVFCTNLYSGKKTRFERYDIAGIIKPELLPDWAKEKLSFIKEIEKDALSFEYNGKHFVPIGNIPKDFDFNKIIENSKSDRDMGMSKYDWANKSYSYKSFYNASRGSKADIFKCYENGKKYLPSENELFEYTGEIKEKAKSYKEAER